jgi:hypothetical protein
MECLLMMCSCQMLKLKEIRFAEFVYSNEEVF